MERPNFLERLQTSDEAMKRRWMAGIVIVVMIIVVYLWLAYFNNLVANSSQPQPVAQQPAERDVSFWPTFEQGLAAISHALSGLFGASKEYTITPSN